MITQSNFIDDSTLWTTGFTLESNNIDGYAKKVDIKIPT